MQSVSRNQIVLMVTLAMGLPFDQPSVFTKGFPIEMGITVTGPPGALLFDRDQRLH